MHDFLQVDDLLTDEDRAIRDTVRDFAQSELAPHIAEWYDEGTLPDDLDGACAALARRLADGPTLGLQQTKSLITRELDMPIGPAMELDAMTQALLMTTHDHAEFHAAFNAKRPPEWTGR